MSEPILSMSLTYQGMGWDKRGIQRHEFIELGVFRHRTYSWRSFNLEIVTVIDVNKKDAK